MPVKTNERQYRMLSALLSPVKAEREKRFDTEYYIEGYASTFNDPYVLYEDYDGNEYREIIAPEAFEDADMSDIILQYNHDGRVYARTANETLFVQPDEHGLFMAADLSSTSASREFFEDIDTGLITKMSWAFSIEANEYNRKTRTNTITKVRKVYDVSAVSYPADPNTSISARCLLNSVDGAIAELAQVEQLRRRKAVAIAKARLKILEVE